LKLASEESRHLVEFTDESMMPEDDENIVEGVTARPSLVISELNKKTDIRDSDV
jgi:hypothetical protein